MVMDIVSIDNFFFSIFSIFILLKHPPMQKYVIQVHILKVCGIMLIITLLPKKLLLIFNKSMLTHAIINITVTMLPSNRLFYFCAIK